MSIVAADVYKSIGSPPTQILSGISLEIEKGDFVALTGRSGSGKSTLLYLLSSMDLPTSGIVKIGGYDTSRMEPEEIHNFRNRKIGFVFQFHYLISELTVLDNVLMPTRKFELEKERREYAESLLTQFGLQEKRHRLPRQLSGGEQQRVAIARALILEPEYLFADEPTGSLDSINSDIVMNIIRKENKEKGTTVVMVTHDPDFAEQADWQLRLVDGHLADKSGSDHSSS